MAGMLAVMDDAAHILTLHRTHQPFAEREREILNAIQPHLVNSYINAIVHSKARNSATQIQAAIETAPGAYGCFDAQGNVTCGPERGWMNFSPMR